MSKAKLIAKRYLLQEKLGEGGMGAIYRALDRLTNQEVALKQVSIALDDSLESYSFRMALAREFQLLATLRHPNIISVLDYGFHEHHRPFFTMQLLQEHRSILEAGQGQPREVLMNLLIQVLQALSYVHQRGLVHRDLKPSNLMVDPDGKVKLLDFGLATPHREDGEQVGTLSYMAPEIFEGYPASPASDLYALGVIAYQLTTGMHPFRAERVDKMIENIMTQAPDLTPFQHYIQQAALQTSSSEQEATILLPTEIAQAHRERARQTQDSVAALDPLGAVIMRLLAKDPKDRYRNAQEVIFIFHQMMGQSLPLQSQDIRESFLQAAELVGRDEEIVHFSQELFSAVAGQGSAWLIGGESGIGKSRLLDEIATIAQISDVVVLRGQAWEDQHEFEFWRPSLRRLLLSIEVNDEEAALLKPILPDIETLLGRSIHDSLQLDSRAQYQQLHNTMVRLFQRHKTPTLLILEDLQWAEQALPLISRLSQEVVNWSLLILASYRDDTRPTLPEALPFMQPMKLERLSPQAIKHLSRAMLGEAGERPEVLELLQEETEGNVFFLVEIARVLAEEAGTLTDIGIKTLHRQVITEGIRGIVRQRISRLPLDGQPTLRLAAVLGREINFEVLRQLDDMMDYDLWAVECQTAALLTWQDGKWRFAHDKLREGLLMDLAEDEVRRLHGLAAWAIEETYPNNPSYSNAIMEHWHIAQQIEKEAEYTLKAAHFALQKSDLAQARELFERALVITPDHPPTLYQLQIGLAETYLLMGHYDLASRAAQRSYQYALLSQNPQQQITSQTLLGLVAIQRGQHQAAQGHLGQAASFSLYPPHPLMLFAKGHLEWLQGNFPQAETDLGQSLRQARQHDDPWLMMRLFSALGSVAESQGQLTVAQEFYESNLDLSREVGNRAQEAAALKDLGVIHHRRGDDSQASLYFRSAIHLAHEVNHRRVQALALLHLSGIELDAGQWAQAPQTLYQALTLLLNLGSIPSLLLGGEYAGHWLAQQGQRASAIELWQWIWHHPAASEDIKQTCHRLLAAHGQQPIPPTSDPAKGFDRAIRQVLLQLGKF